MKYFVDEGKIKKKSRAIIFNDKNEVLIANYGGVYLFPGGSISNGETPDETVIRELKEEVGLEFNKLDKFIEFRQFQKQYPTRDGETINRIVDTYYYIGNEVDAIKCDIELTEEEKQDGFKFMYYNIDEIEKLLKNNKTDNPRNKYFSEEINIVINLYKDIVMENECEISLNKDYINNISNIKKRIL